MSSGAPKRPLEGQLSQVESGRGWGGIFRALMSVSLWISAASHMGAGKVALLCTKLCCLLLSPILSQTLVRALEQVHGWGMWFVAGLGCCTQAGLT